MASIAWLRLHGRAQRAGVLELAEQAGLECPLEIEEASYFLSTIDLQVGEAPGMTRWRKRLFVATSKITADAAEYFGLHRARTVTMGSRGWASSCHLGLLE